MPAPTRPWVCFLQGYPLIHLLTAPHLPLLAVWSTGQDTNATIKRQLQRLLPGISAFLDVDDLEGGALPIVRGGRPCPATRCCLAIALWRAISTQSRGECMEAGRAWQRGERGSLESQIGISDWNLGLPFRFLPHGRHRGARELCAGECGDAVVPQQGLPALAQLPS